MQKIKSLNFGFMSIIKSVLIGIVTTLIGVVIFAVVLKFVDVPSNMVNYINDVIKCVSIFVVVMLLKKVDSQNLLLRAVAAGCLYAILSFVIFSILNGGFDFNLSILFDLLFALIVSVVAAIMVNLTRKRN